MNRYCFGPFELDPDELALSRNGVPVRLQELPLRLLLLLVARAGAVVTRDEVRHGLWPENTFVEFDNNLGVAVRKVREALNDNAEAPRYVATVPRRGYRFVAPVTLRKLELVSDSFAAGNQITHPPFPDGSALPVPPDGSMPLPTNPSPTNPRNLLWVGLVLFLLLSAAAAYRFRSRPHFPLAQTQQGPVVAEPHLRRSVAVLGFRNLSSRGQDDWLSPVFAEMLNTELGVSSDLRMISGEDVARAKRELPMNDQDSLAKTTLQRLRTNLGADVVLLGSYILVNKNGTKQIRLDLRLQDTGRGETIAEEAITGDAEDLLSLAARAGGSLRDSLSVKTRPEAESALRAVLPANQQSTRLYAEGRARLWAFDMLGARDLLAKAVAADPKFPLAHSALSEALWHLGYQVKARFEAQRALELAPGLPAEDRLLIQGQYRRSVGDFPQAVEAYQTLFQMFPDSLDYGLLLESAQLRVAPSAALHTLATLRNLPAPEGDDARIDMAEAAAWIGQDTGKARAAARLAIAKGTAQGSHALVGWTYGILCQQGTNAGESADTAIGECENARASSRAAHDLNGEAMAVNNIAGDYFQKGDITRCEEMFHSAIQEFTTIGDLDGAATAKSNLADARIAVGDLAGAKKLLESATLDYQAIQDEEGVALNLNNLGDLLRQSGDLQVAETTFEQAKATAEAKDYKSATAYVLSGLGDVLADRGDLVSARKSYEQALSLRNQIGEKATAGETEVGLAALSIEEGAATSTEGPLRQWIVRFNNEQRSDDELIARTTLVQALLAEGKQVEAQKEADDSQGLAAGSQSLFVRLQFKLCIARVLTASGAPARAKPLLNEVLVDAQKYGYTGIRLEAMLAQAELERRTGSAAAAQKQLLMVQQEARAKGFGLIARKAKALSV